MSNNLESKSREELIQMVELLQELNSVQSEMIQSLESKNELIQKDLAYWKERCDMAQRTVASVINVAKEYENGIESLYKKHKR